MLKSQTALNKDKRTAEYRGADAFQHRHYAFVAAVIAALPDDIKGLVAGHFASAFAAKNGNPRFNRQRFFNAVGKVHERFSLVDNA